MNLRIGLVLLFGGLLACGGLRAQSTPATALLVLSKSDHTLAIVDPSTLKIVARMPSGPDPHEVVASADGRFAYISNYGGGAYNTITAIDLVAQKALPPVDLGALRGPHGLAFAGGKVWFTAEAAKVIGSYDPVAKQIDWVLGTGQNRTHMVFVSEDLKRIVTSNVSSATMTIIEKSSGGGGRGPGGPPPGMPDGRGPAGPAMQNGGGPPSAMPDGRGPGGPPMQNGPGGPPSAMPDGRAPAGLSMQNGAGGPPPGMPDGRGPGGLSMQNGPGRGGPMGGAPQGDWDETVVAVGRGAEGFDVGPDGKEIWAANAQDGTISIVSVPNKKVIQTLAANVMGANRLKFTPDGKLVFVSSLSGPDVAIFDAATRAEVKRVKVGRGAAGIQMQPDGSRVFVACTPDGYVAIIDLKSLEVTGHIDAGKQPDGLAWAVRP